MTRPTFQVWVNPHPPLHRVPVVPREDEGCPARGVLVGLALSVPVWWSLAAVVMWARGGRL